jgi:hypothetical protein
MPDKPTPAPKSPNHPSNIARNIIVGAITTILGSTAVWFITNRGKNPKSEMEILLLTKDATTNAWKSYVTFENVYTKKSLSLINDMQTRTIGMDEFVTETERESDKFKTSITDLMTKPNIDKDFIDGLNSRLDNEKLTKPTLEKYAHFINALKDTNLTQDEKIKALQEEGVKWEAQSKGVTDRAITDIEDIAKTLSVRYGQTFAMTDFLVYNIVMHQRDSLARITKTNAPNDSVKKIEAPIIVENVKEIPPTTQLVTGKWIANPPNGADIDFSKNGKFFWHVLSNGDHISGAWKLVKNVLNLYPMNEETGKKGQWAFNLSLFTANSFSMKLNIEPHNLYKLTRQQPTQ